MGSRSRHGRCMEMFCCVVRICIHKRRLPSDMCAVFICIAFRFSRRFAFASIQLSTFSRARVPSSCRTHIVIMMLLFSFAPRTWGLGWPLFSTSQLYFFSSALFFSCRALFYVMQCSSCRARGCFIYKVHECLVGTCYVYSCGSQLFEC